MSEDKQHQAHETGQQWMAPFADRVREYAVLANMCWFKTGGPARYLFKPTNMVDLKYFLTSKPADLEVFVLGIGSNLLVRDAGFSGCVIRLGRSFNYITHNDATVTAGAAVLDLNVAYYAAEHGIAGLEFFSGIPGTIGGALAMNAGAYGNDTASVLITATAINDKGQMAQFTPGEIGYYYRGKHLGPEWIFLEASFAGHAGDSAAITAEIAEVQAKREQTQPIRERTSGSTFKNPEGQSAWKLIDSAGCRGLKIGGAMVSEMHCNFFLNTGNATSTDIEQLITEVQRRVYEQSGIRLETEIKIIGVG